MSATQALRDEVFRRAHGFCEYCLIHQDDTAFPHEPDHIVARRHDGPTHLGNLALACFRCNRLKGSDLGSIDPETGEFALFFNPRTQSWAQHFRLDGVIVRPLTPEGRVTVKLLRLNDTDRLLERELLISVGRYLPPKPATQA